MENHQLQNLLQYGADIDPLLSEYLEFVFDQPANTEKLRLAGAHDWRKTVDQLMDMIKPDKTQTTRDRRALAMAEIYKRPV